MSAHPYKSAMLDQLAAQADGIIEMREEREAMRNPATWRMTITDQRTTIEQEPPKPSLLARIRAWWPL